MWKEVELDSEIRPFKIVHDDKNVHDWRVRRCLRNLQAWTIVPRPDPERHVVVSNPALQCELAQAVGGRSSGVFRIATTKCAKFPDNGIVQIPVMTSGGVMSVLSLEPVVKWVIPNDPVSVVQRRVHRWYGVALPRDHVEQTIKKRTPTRVSPNVKLVRPSASSAVLLLVDAAGQQEQVYP